MITKKVTCYAKRMLGVIAAIVVFLVNVMPVNATQVEAVSVPMIVLDKYEVSGEKIVPGEDFTLSFTLVNYHTSQTAYDVMVDISNPSGVAPVYGTVSQVYVGDMEPGESKKISLDYNSFTSITGDTIDFYMTIVSSLNQNYITLRIPTGSDSPFSIQGSNVPGEAMVNETVLASISFKVLGEENVSNVVLAAKTNGETIANSQIGIVTPGTTKTQTLAFSFWEKGEYVVDLELEYTDTLGQKKSVPVGTELISVSEKPNSNGDDTSTDEVPNAPNNETSNILFMGISGILILVIFLVIVIIVRKNK